MRNWIKRFGLFAVLGVLIGSTLLAGCDSETVDELSVTQTTERFSEPGSQSEAATQGERETITLTKKNAPTTFMGAAKTTWDAWHSWLQTLSSYAVAIVGGLIAYAIGFIVFLFAFFLGGYAPVAARSGFRTFAFIWFVLLAAIFIPLAAPFWWWLAAFLGISVLLAFIPKARAVS